MKRFLSILLVLCIALSVVPVTAAAASKVELSLWTYPIGEWGNADAVDALIDKFEQANPGVAVQVTYLDYMSGDDRIATALEAGNAPDLILEGPERLVSRWGEQGRMVDLSGLIDSTDRQEIYTYALEACYGSDGKLYEYPLCGTVHTMAINKTVFKKAGALKYLNEETRTWNSVEAFYKAVEAVYDYTGQTVGSVYCGSIGGDQGTRALLTNLSGSSYTDPTNSYYTWNTTAMKNTLSRLSKSDAICMDDGIVGGDEIALFYRGYLNMSFCWNVDQQRNPNMAGGKAGKTANGEEIMFVAFPADANSKLQGGIWGLGIVDNGSSKKINAAKTFIKYMCDSKATADAVKTAGYFPVRDTAEGVDLSKIWSGNKTMSEYQKLMPMLGDYYAVTPNWVEARIAWISLLTDVAMGKNISTALKTWTNNANAGLNTSIKKTKLSVLAAQYSDRTEAWWSDFEYKYEALNKSIDLVVDVRSWNDIYGVVNSCLENNNAPDILNIDGYLDYWAEDLLLSADTYLSDETYRKFPKNFLKESEKNGKVWAIPDLTSTRALYYNADLLDSVGAKVPATWAEVLEVSAALKAKYGSKIIPWGIDMSEDDGITSIATYLWSNGGDFVNNDGQWRLDSVANLEALEYAVKLYQKGYTNSAGTNRYDLQSMFADGSVAMMIAPDGFRSWMDGVNYGVAAIPANNGHTSSAPGVMDRFVCFDNHQSTKKMNAITAFFDAFYEDYNYTTWTNLEGLLPATSSGIASLAKKDSSMAAWVTAVNNARFLPAGKANWYDVRTGMVAALQKALDGGNLKSLLKQLNQSVGGSEFDLRAPTSVKASNVESSGKISLSWKKVEGAKEYKVYRATSKTGTYKLMKTTTSTSYINTSAEAGKAYYYYVVALDANGGKSDKSSIVSRTCDLAQPTITLSNRASDGAVRIQWETITGATKYEVYRASSKTGTYSRMGSTGNTYYNSASGTAGKTYYYKVRALCGSENATGAFSEVKSRTRDLAQPKVTLSNVASTGKIKVSWEPVEGAKEYKVYRATTKSGTDKLMKTTTAASYTNTSVDAGKTYYYRVVAVHENSTANSAYSEIKSRTCDLARPVVSVSLNSSGKPVVSWKSISGAEEYEIYVYNSSGKLLRTADVDGTKWTDKSAKAGTTYTYKVVAEHDNDSANSAKSTGASIKSK